MHTHMLIMSDMCMPTHAHVHACLHTRRRARDPMHQSARASDTLPYTPGCNSQCTQYCMHVLYCMYCMHVLPWMPLRARSLFLTSNGKAEAHRSQVPFLCMPSKAMNGYKKANGGHTCQSHSSLGLKNKLLVFGSVWAYGQFAMGL